MPQRLKEEVRARILTAGATIFAKKGYEVATLAEVANACGMATSNIYKYYPNKNALLDAIVTPSLAARLLRLMRRRVRELTNFEAWSSAQNRQSTAAADLLSFWIDHRLQVLILFRPVDGTRFSKVRPRFVYEMERLAIELVMRTRGPGAVTPESRFVLRTLFANTADMIVAILDHFEDPDSIRSAFAAFWTYQLAGLQELLDARSAPTAN
ncbi:TetR/AcrR family transcriptional regulator [Rhizobium sp. RU36D]|uniref:TetR/AcrR family transcriptional regulator n=1 Tax=Rhizobium sp. RU36D TaxID=1907415 RepID=UPI0009D821F0|nr:TetR/AcrR family transcriptional regulator [Rhizobium sp. RU36D]SMC84708.1 transcriptional regulator, TetR family [Rhizobium sp. RU36D]